MAWCIVCFFTYLAHNYDRHLRRIQLAKAPNIRRIRSAEFAASHRASAKAKAAALRSHLDAIDLRWMSSTFLNLFFLPTVLCAERSIVQLLAEASAGELNLLLQSIELPLILYKVKDHRVAQCFSRSQLLALLAEERVAELSVSSKAILLDALQKLKLSAHPRLEQYVQRIVCSTRGDELSELKCLTDAKGDIHSLHSLIYSDIRSPVVRKELLDYIRSQVRRLTLNSQHCIAVDPFAD